MVHIPIHGCKNQEASQHNKMDCSSKGMSSGWRTGHCWFEPPNGVTASASGTGSILHSTHSVIAVLTVLKPRQQRFPVQCTVHSTSTDLLHSILSRGLSISNKCEGTNTDLPSRAAPYFLSSSQLGTSDLSPPPEKKNVMEAK